MDIISISFWLISIVLVVSALGVIFFKNIVHSALSLVVTFIGVAGLYLLLEAEFLAAVQVLVYGGAISIIIVFGILLIQRNDISQTNLFNEFKIWGILVAAAFTGSVTWLLLKTPWAIESIKPVENITEKIAELMLGDYVISFEIAAVLLLVAMIGAIVIAREVKNS